MIRKVFSVKKKFKTPTAAGKFRIITWPCFSNWNKTPYAFCPTSRFFSWRAVDAHLAVLPFWIGEKLLAYPLGRKCHPAKIDLPKSPGNRYPALFCKTPLLIVWGNRNVRCKRRFSHVGIIFLFGVSFSGKPRLFPFFLSNLQPVFPKAANWGVEFVLAKLVCFCNVCSR